MTVELLGNHVRVPLSVIFIVLGPFRVSLSVLGISWLFIDLLVKEGVGGVRVTLSVLSISGLLIVLSAKEGVDGVSISFSLDSRLGKEVVEFGSQFFLFLNTDFILIDGGILCNALALAGRASRSRGLIGLLAGSTLLRGDGARST
jgi:hypothetical protein